MSFVKLNKKIIRSLRNLDAGIIYAYAESIKVTIGKYPSIQSIIDHFKIDDLNKHKAFKELKRLNLLQDLINEYNKGLKP